MSSDPVRWFLALYCGTIALQTLLRYRDQLRFFRTTPVRVYGQAPPLFGFIPLPPIGERLFIWAGAGFIIALTAAASGVVVRASLIAALVCFLVYFPPILPLGYIQRKANLIPIVLAVLIVAPAQTLLFARLFLSLVYLSSGLEKLRGAGIRWIDGRTLQAYLIENYLYTDRRRTLWLAKHLYLCRILSALVLAWELTFWLVIPFPATAWIYVPFGLAFHAGTAIFMRIHYWIYFCPVYFAFPAAWLSAMTRSHL